MGMGVMAAIATIVVIIFRVYKDRAITAEVDKIIEKAQEHASSQSEKEAWDEFNR